LKELAISQFCQMVHFSLRIFTWKSQKLSVNTQTTSVWPSSGVNFINILHEVLKRADPKSAKKTVKLSLFFAFLESVRVKAGRKMLVKLAPGAILSTFVVNICFT